MGAYRASLILLCVAGCADDAGPEPVSQLPPQGATSIEAWLASGAYKTWQCEPAVHAARAPSPHGYNRICSNDAISANKGAGGPWPKGAAAVKELYASADASTPFGYSVYIKTADDSAEGANWYWYERLPKEQAAKFELPEVVADGLGDRGGAKDVCVACHIAAGRDPAHTPSVGGRDQVYTPVE
ncbi:MAG TPA: hypothetical protein VI299_26490 [Polyangiales bacterium]